MSNDNPNIIYPEMLEYRWAKDFERAKLNSKYVKGEGGVIYTESEIWRKVPVNFVMAVVEEAVCYPEVMAAYRNESGDETRDKHLLMWFHEYMRHKYGNVTQGPNPQVLEHNYPSIHSSGALRGIANGKYTGVNDPKLLQDMLGWPFIGADDGYDYRLPALDANT